jgi:hypothetical protein
MSITAPRVDQLKANAALIPDHPVLSARRRVRPIPAACKVHQGCPTHPQGQAAEDPQEAEEDTN